MKRMIMVCGRVGAGKTTYSLKLADEIGALKISIDQWMQTLYAADMKTINFNWMMERVNRCYVQIWDVSSQTLKNNGSVILDLSFTTRSERNFFLDRASEIGIDPEIHYLEAPEKERRERVVKRNLEKNPEVYSFDVTKDMIDFMEPRFEDFDDRERRLLRII